MSFSRNFFNKSLGEITAPDLLTFFKQGHVEGQHLEFKSGEVSIDKILKEICAFLNSEGGLLIVGAPREEDIPGLEGGRYSFGEPVTSGIASPELLVKRIQTGIVPTPDTIKIQQVLYSSGSVYLIEVDPSNNPPHQLHGSGQYYMREGAISRPALHHEVEDMILNKRRPKLDLQIELERPNDAIEIKLIITNTSEVPAEEPGFILEVFPDRQSKDNYFNTQRLLRDNYLAPGQRWVESTSVLTRDPRFFLSCRYYSKGSPPKLKAAFAEIINNKIELLKVFNSEVHDDFKLWYEEWVYLLTEDQ